MKWPEGFLMGAATAAHQVEGNNTGSDCWVMEHLPHSDFAQPSGLAADHYHRFEEDIRLLSDAGLNAYRFSIEWARIEPEEGKFDQDALEHYRRVLASCRAHHITPVVTLHHFSSPAWLIRKGGWASEHVIGAFERYCDYVAEHLGEEIPYFCTINEANMGGQLNKIAAMMMNTGKQKEGSVQVGTNSDVDMKSAMLTVLEQSKAFDCAPGEVNAFLKPRDRKQELIVMQAHAAGREAILKKCPDAKVGLTLSLFDYQPLPGAEEMAGSLWKEDFEFYLPYFEKDAFLGVQNYTRKQITENGETDMDPEMPLTQMGYEEYPSSLGNVLRKVSESYHGRLIVTENGIATADDRRRIRFIKNVLTAVNQCLKDGLPVDGYFYWSLLDNFEWQAGYGKTFGLIEVNRETMERTPKASLYEFGKMFQESRGQTEKGTGDVSIAARNMKV